jgi:hypothetical protein
MVVKAVRDCPCYYTPGGTLIFSNVNTPEELAGIKGGGA